LETQTHAVVEAMFVEHGRSLVRLAGLFVDDRAAAEDLVQEAFIRLSRSLDRIRDPDRAAAYLRSIVLNLARDHNRRGLVSLRHRPPSLPYQRTADETLELEDDQRHVVEALRTLPRRQRDVLVLRYYLELSPPEIAETLGLSVNSVKTHQRRGMAAMQDRLGGGS
jgi:RNA polymerase sigma-70 factor (sigma-E family)